jgi:DNA mismatch repair ATPase MutS
MLQDELDDGYFALVERHLEALHFKHGTLISAQLGTGNKGTGYVLRLPREQSWLERITSFGRWRYSFQIHERDQAGMRAYSELEDRSMNTVGNALAQSTDHIKSFFTMMVTELAFYVGCLNLHEQLDAKGEPTCVPDPTPAGTPRLSARGLYDVCLSLKLDDRVVGNDVDADGKSLVMITGANQGGKSTFLRSVGLAQLMMQSGMFVPATAFTADVRERMFTHYKREEDASMDSGKLDEELARMSQITDGLTPASMLLCNESFASTNEREGSEIARQIVGALNDAGVKLVYVTHLYELAHGLHAARREDLLFLRAERREDGERTYRLLVGAPLPTSFGEDTYRRIFDAAGDRERNRLTESHR